MDTEDLYKLMVLEKPVLIQLTRDEIETIYRSFVASQKTAETYVENYEQDDPGRGLWIGRLESLKKLIDRWEREFSDYALDSVNDD